jgi:hypothetical protein
VPVLQRYEVVGNETRWGENESTVRIFNVCRSRGVGTASARARVSPGLPLDSLAITAASQSPTVTSQTPPLIIDEPWRLQCTRCTCRARHRHPHSMLVMMNKQRHKLPTIRIAWYGKGSDRLLVSKLNCLGTPNTNLSARVVATPIYAASPRRWNQAGDDSEQLSADIFKIPY